MDSTNLNELAVWPKDRLTKFEVARLLGARALQVSLGAPVLVKTEHTTPIDIAKAEFRGKAIPITVKRKLPNSEQTVVDVKNGIVNWLVDNKGEI